MAAIAPKPFICDHCMIAEGKARCGKCKAIRYCSRACQDAAWALHKTVCVPKEKEIPLKEWLDPINGVPRLFYYARSDQTQLPDLVQRRLKKPVATPIGQISIQQIEALTQIPDPNGMTGLLFQEGEEVPRFLSQQEHHQRFGTYFIAGNHVPREELGTYLAIPAPTRQNTPIADLNVTFFPHHQAILDRFYANPPRILVREESPQQGYGLQTLDPIAEGGIVCIVSGKRTCEAATTAKGVLDNFGDLEQGGRLDQTQYTGYGRCVNDGPVDSVWGRVWGDVRLPPETLVIRTVRDVPANTFLHVSYGIRHPIRSINYSLSPEQRQEIAAFCHSQPDPFVFFEQIMQNNPKVSNMQYLHQNGMFDLIFNSPYVFFTLILDEVLSLDSMIAFLEKDTTESFFTEHHFAYKTADLIKILQHLSPVMNDKVIIQTLSQSLEKICQYAWYLTLKTTPNNYPINGETLEAHLKKGRLIEQIFRLVNPYYFPQKKEEEGKEDPFDPDAFLASYRQLPLPLQDNKFLLKIILTYTKNQDEKRFTKSNIRIINTLMRALSV